jgi:hypothetical protein
MFKIRLYHFRSVLIRCRISLLMLLFIFAAYLTPVYAEPSVTEPNADEIEALILISSGRVTLSCSRKTWWTE